MNVKELISNSHLAFLNQENNTALSLAKKAIELDKKNSDAYKCAGNALMSLERYKDAIENYSFAVKYDEKNGNRYYDLGFAQATCEHLADAIKSFSKADELGCTPENFVQLYNLLGIICFDIGRYDDALVNLGKAEQLIGIDLEILQRKATIYGIKNDIRNGLHVANQIKLIAPSEYTGYNLAFKLLLQSKRIEIAKKELRKAEKYATLNSDYYFDKLSLEMQIYSDDKDQVHLYNSLNIINESLKLVKPNVESVSENYINAAEIYLRLKNADKTISCLLAAKSPVESYNESFEIIDEIILPPAEFDDYSAQLMLEEDKLKLQEELGEYGLEELAENAQLNEDGEYEFFTEIEDEHEENIDFKLDKSENYEISKENLSQINRLYIGAYTLKKDYEKVIKYARLLQADGEIQNTYIGKYTEVNALKEMNAENFVQMYKETIKFFRNAMIKDPADIMAVTFRIQCLVDIEMYDEAEEICKILSSDIRKSLLEKIEEAKLGGE